MNLIETNLENFSNSIEREYSKYVQEHIANVILGYTYIAHTIPSMLEDLEIPADEFKRQIMKHDESKWSEEEFKAYAEHFYGSMNGVKDDPEFEKACP